MVVALDQGLSSTGVSRVRCDRGWVSVNAANGQPVLVSAEDTAHVDGNRAEAAAPSPQGAHRARPPTGGSADRSRLRNNRPRVAAGAGDAYPKMPAGTLGLSAGHALRQQQLEERRRSKPPSGRKSVSSAALQGEGIGPVVRGRQWHHMVRKLKHTDPTTGAATAVRPAVGVASEVRSEERLPFSHSFPHTELISCCGAGRSRGEEGAGLRDGLRRDGPRLEVQPSGRCASLALAPLPLIFSYTSEKTLCGTGLVLWARKGHVGTAPAAAFGAAAVAGRVGAHFRQTAWQSPDLFFQKIQDVVEEAEEAGRARERHKARKIM